MRERPLRADAERNRRLVLAAAADAFAQRGLDVGVAEIARRAGVGEATLYRRFPGKEDLIVAIVEERAGELRQAAVAAMAHPDPWAGLVALMEAGAALQARDRGVLAAVAARMGDHPRLWELREELLEAIAAVVARAHAAGALREDVVAEDVAFLMNAAARSCGELSADAPELWRRYLALMTAGLRPGAGARDPLPLPPPTAGDVRGWLRDGAHARRQ